MTVLQLMHANAIAENRKNVDGLKWRSGNSMNERLRRQTFASGRYCTKHYPTIYLFEYSVKHA